MIRTWQRTLLAPLSLALLAACGDDPVKTVDCAAEENAEHPECLVPGEPVLTRVGPGVLELNPGDVITLRALLSQPNVGPLAGHDVTWKLQGTVGGLSTTQSTTAESGLAETQLTVDEFGTLRLSATTEASETRASWAIEVVPVVKRVFVIPSGGVVVETPERGLLTTAINRAAPLRVKVSYDDGRPIVQEKVTFTLDGNEEAGIFLHSTEVITDGRGEAGVLLETGTQPSNAEIQAAVTGAPSAFFIVRVQPSVDGGSCSFSSQCAPGQVCVGGRCTNMGEGGGCDFGQDRACPIGYRCSTAGVCEPAFGSTCGECPNGYVCDEGAGGCVPVDPECDWDELECPDGFTCEHGICQSEDDPYDVTGRWFTRHHFAVGEALPGWVSTLGKAFSGANDVLRGRLSGVPSWVNAILKSVVDAYIPEWVVTLAYLGDSLFTIFSDLRAEGEMMLNSAGPNLVRGEEYWVSFIFNFLPQCGRDFQRESLFNPPQCARLDVYTSELEGTDMAVEVKPFWARVGGSSVIFDRREVDMAFQGLLKYALDQFALMMTGYPTFEEALPHMIDCQGMNGSIGSFDISIICEIAAAAAGAAISDSLRGAKTNQRDMLTFQGTGTISQATGRRATYLGYPNNEEWCSNKWCRRPADGLWNGRFQFVTGVNDVPGRWRASRTPIR